MPEPGDTGSTEEMFHCPNCGNDFAVMEDDSDEPCPVCHFQCTRDSCLIHNASNVDF